MSDRQALLGDLRDQLRRLGAAGPAGGRAPLGFGIAALDSALPWGGLARGGIHEFLGDPGAGAAFGLVAALLGRLAPTEGTVLWCRATGAAAALHGPGLARFGCPLDRLILVEARGPIETLWVLEEALRCRHLAAAVGEGTAPTLTAGRRLQLAAEAGGTIGLLLPPALARPPPSVALTRWRIAAVPAGPEGGGAGRPRWSVALLRCRGGGVGEWILEWDDEAVRFALAADLADRLPEAAIPA